MVFARRIASAFVAVLLVTAGGAALAGPASAADWECPSGYSCGWRDGNYISGTSGQINIRFQSNIRNLGSYTWSDTKKSVNDSVSSLYNNGKVQAATWYEHADFVGRNVYLARQTGNNNLNGISLNDQLSSGRFV